jgi:hypothetical protein
MVTPLSLSVDLEKYGKPPFLDEISGRYLLEWG